MNKYRLYLVVLGIAFVFIYFLLELLNLNQVKARHLSKAGLHELVIIQKRNLPVHAWIISYQKDSENVSIKRIPGDLYIRNNNNEYANLFSRYSKSRIKKIIDQKLSIDLSGVYKFSVSDWDKLLAVFGGMHFFNTEAGTVLPEGEVLIHEKNFTNYLNSLPYGSHRQETALSLWINAVFQVSEVFGQGRRLEVLTRKINRRLPFFRMRFASFYKLKSFLFTFPKVNIHYSSLNTSRVYLGQNQIYTFFQDGEIDKSFYKKFTSEYSQAQNFFPISVQVRNTTTIPRLAAKTAGILRIKRCDVREYLNSPLSLSESILIDRSGWHEHREYLRKVTKINEVIFKLNYRQDFDFTVYLGEDYYAIPFVTNQ